MQGFYDPLWRATVSLLANGGFGGPAAWTTEFAWRGAGRDTNEPTAAHLNAVVALDNGATAAMAFSTQLGRISRVGFVVVSEPIQSWSIQ